ncbi:hypothetical protein V6N11_027373 [Hibiscus sabdariffa]|uniref:Uncharacterized protein n=1 Tax=Hibiscus sabdariffa TaxID=183260 RepID=A0ABR2PGU5_9ROSI
MAPDPPINANVTPENTNAVRSQPSSPTMSANNSLPTSFRVSSVQNFPKHETANLVSKPGVVVVENAGSTVTTNMTQGQSSFDQTSFARGGGRGGNGNRGRGRGRFQGRAQDDIQQGDTQRQQFYSPSTEYTYMSEGHFQGYNQSSPAQAHMVQVQSHISPIQAYDHGFHHVVPLQSSITPGHQMVYPQFVNCPRASSPFITTSVSGKQQVSASSSVAPSVGHYVVSSSNATPGPIVSTSPTALQASSSQSTLFGDVSWYPDLGATHHITNDGSTLHTVLSTRVPSVDRVFTSSSFVEPQRESSRANIDVRDIGLHQEVGMRDDHNEPCLNEEVILPGASPHVYHQNSRVAQDSVILPASSSQGVEQNCSQVRIENSADIVCHQDSDADVLQGNHDENGSQVRIENSKVVVLFEGVGEQNDLQDRVESSQEAGLQEEVVFINPH